MSFDNGLKFIVEAEGILTEIAGLDQEIAEILANIELLLSQG